MKPRDDKSLLFKDAILDELGERANIAQFVSFDPRGAQRYSRVLAFARNYQFTSIVAAAAALLEASSEKSVNVRSFDPSSPESREFIYGLKSTGDVEKAVKRLGSAGLFTIINETIDVKDGGVSGVALGDVIEFAPGDTPRAVEKPGITSLPRRFGLEVLRTVYGFDPDLAYAPSERVEFSIHPIRRGVRQTHTLVWQLESVTTTASAPRIKWPNRFSQFIGDKAFGLLIAHHLGLPVPQTTAICRTVRAFCFGVPTGSGQYWIRTVPWEQVPGKFTTSPIWLDPFKLVQTEDPQGLALASVLSQEGVDARFSGAVLTTASGQPVVEGVTGTGDRFMLGLAGPGELPSSILDDVRALHKRACFLLGPVRFEWVHDGHRAWLVQLHVGASAGDAHTIVPGEAPHFHRFEVRQGIDSLRLLLDRVRMSGEGIVLVGAVGVTSHYGDLLRRAGIPSRIEPEPGH